MKGPDHLSEEGASSPSSSTSLSLLEQAQQGDEAAWQRVVAIYRPLVSWWCKGRAVRREDTEDVVQEVFATVLELFRRAPFVRQRPGSFRAWLRQITTHKIEEHESRLRKRPIAAGGSDARETFEQLPDQRAAAPTAEDEVSELRTLLRSGLDLLRPEFKPATWEAAMRTLSGQPTTAVAADLGISTNAVLIAKSRVLARLRQEMPDLLD